MQPERFEIAIPESVLADLRQRLARTRLPPDEDRSDWSAGQSPRYLRQITEYWRSEYDFRAQEAAINRLPHFRVKLGQGSVHFIHERGRGTQPLPLLLTHGFPDSFLRFEKLIGLLTDPEAYGADPGDAFDVVVPSLPGYAFSDADAKPGGIFRIGKLWHELMTDVLGYQRFGAHGGDWGSTVTEHLARGHAGSVVGIHLTDVPFWHAFQKPKSMSPAEEKYFSSIERFMTTEGAYAAIQGTRPGTLTDALSDSPVGLLAWLVEKYERWSDCHGNVESCFSKDELITNAVLYWVTSSVESSFAPYYDLTHAGAARWILEKAKEWAASAEVPAGFAIFPKDLSHPPRQWAERFFNVRRWTVLPRGGHFAALEEPELLAEELREFFRPLRNDDRELPVAELAMAGLSGV